MLKSTIVYVAATVLNSAIPFLLLPVLTSYLVPADYGILSLLLATYSVVLPIVTFGVTSGVVVYYHKMSQHQFQIYLGNAILVNTVVALLFVIIAILILRFLDGNVFGIPSKALLVVPLWALCQTVVSISYSLYQASGSRYRYAMMLIGTGILNMALSLLLVVKYDLGWQGRIAGIVLSLLVMGGLALVIIIREYGGTLKRDFVSIKRIMQFGLPLMPHAIGGVALAMTSRIVVQHYLGSSDLGIYTVAFQISSMVIVVGSAVSTGWQPYLYEQLALNTATSKNQIVRVSLVLSSLVILSGVLLVIAMPVVYKYIVDAAYWEGIWVAQGLVVGGTLNAVYFLYSGYFFYYENTSTLAKVTIGVGMATILINIITISLYGMVGAVVSYIFTWLSFTVSVMILAGRIVKLPWMNLGIETKSS